MRAGYRRGPLRSGVVRPEEQRLDLACEAAAVPRRKRGALNIEGGGVLGVPSSGCAHVPTCGDASRMEPLSSSWSSVVCAVNDQTETPPPLSSCNRAPVVVPAPRGAHC